MIMQVFAAFAVVILPNGRIAGTTRPGGGVGLPGGKVEPGENPVRAAAREAAEEGWNVDGFVRAVHDKIIEGKLVMWFAFERAERRAEWKERGRIEPVELTLAELYSSGMGNDMVARKIKRANEMLPLLRAAARATGKDATDAKLVAAGAAGAWPDVDLPDDDPREMYRYIADAMHRIGVIVYGSIPHAYTKPEAFVEWARQASAS
jgi:ADP-ribose pyrophosphatase YjhB (NUDIX family)